MKTSVSYFFAEFCSLVGDVPFRLVENAASRFIFIEAVWIRRLFLCLPTLLLFCLLLAFLFSLVLVCGFVCRFPSRVVFLSCRFGVLASRFFRSLSVSFGLPPLSPCLCLCLCALLALVSRRSVRCSVSFPECVSVVGFLLGTIILKSASARGSTAAPDLIAPP